MAVTVLDEVCSEKFSVPASGPLLPDANAAGLSSAHINPVTHKLL